MAITNFRGQYDFLSNFSPSTLLIQGKYYRTVEHAFQSFKTDDPTWRERVRNAKTPAEAKRLGRAAPRRPTWDDEKVKAMEYFLRLKFAEPYAMQRLLATGSEYLIEGNTWGDRFWGCELVNGQWIGQNYLGRLLMKIRDGLEELPS